MENSKFRWFHGALAGIILALGAILLVAGRVRNHASLSSQITASASDAGANYAQVVLGWVESDDLWRVKDTLCLELRGKRFFERDREIPAGGLVDYVDARARTEHARYVLCTPDVATSYGEIVAGIDRLRRCHVAAIVINQASAHIDLQVAELSPSILPFTDEPVKGPYLEAPDFGIWTYFGGWSGEPPPWFHEGSFVAFIFTRDRPVTDQNAVSVVLSVEDGVLGLDWVLRGPRNIRDQELFRLQAQRHGFRVAAESRNGLQYLRVENGNVLRLADDIIHSMYALPKFAYIGIFTHVVSR